MKSLQNLDKLLSVRSIPHCTILQFVHLYFFLNFFLLAARIIMDRETGRSRGFGFVSYTSAEEANAAISGLDGKVCYMNM